MEFNDLVKKLLGNTSKNEVTLGNVNFWIDSDGPWKGQLSYSIPVNQWDAKKVAKELHKKLMQSNVICN